MRRIIVIIKDKYLEYIENKNNGYGGYYGKGNY